MKVFVFLAIFGYASAGVIYSSGPAVQQLQPQLQQVQLVQQGPQLVGAGQVVQQLSAPVQQVQLVQQPQQVLVQQPQQVVVQQPQVQVVQQLSSPVVQQVAVAAPVQQVAVAAPVQQVAVAAPVVKTVVAARAEPFDPHPRYNFGYSVNDQITGDQKSQVEARDGDRVQGQYSLVEPDGHVRTVTYSSDAINGFNANVANTRNNVAVAKVVAHAPTVLAAAPVVAGQVGLVTKVHY